MEHELVGTTMFESFERSRPIVSTGLRTALDGDNQNSEQRLGSSEAIDDDDDDDDKNNEEEGIDIDPVDVDLNLLKYILESHASQDGNTGPATQLLSQLGIKLPYPKISN